LGTVHQNKNRTTGQLFFGQIRTLELRKSARIVQTARFAFSPLRTATAQGCAFYTQKREMTLLARAAVVFAQRNH
jgi:hypothetical protein